MIIVDDQDYSEVSKHRWFLDGKGYATRNVNREGKHRMVLLHREIMGATPGQIVDHANGTRLDNRRSNLRFCTNRENLANRHVVKSSTSRFLGVRKRTDAPRRKPWQARIRDHGKQVCIGYFATEAEAALAYDRVASVVHGQFASLNSNRMEAA